MAPASKPSQKSKTTRKAKTSKTKTSRVKVQEHRDRLRALGLRPIQIWVPDMRARSFRAQAHRQSVAVAASTRARDDQAFIDAITDVRE
jgi:3-deoxy-D-manno-octulosonic-acid transferase